MRTVQRVGLLVAFVVLVSVSLVGCGGGSDQGGAGATTTAQADTPATSATVGGDQTTIRSEATTADAGQNGTGAETEVSGLPADFPSDVPVHPGTVTAYTKTDVTESITSHQLTVQTAASLDRVMDWYETALPAGWSVGFSEKDGDEAKIALDGGDYTPADPNGRGGGVLIGVMGKGTTVIVTTVTVMAR